MEKSVVNIGESHGVASGVTSGHNVENGGRGGDRTRYLVNAIHALSQMSYTPVGCSFPQRGLPQCHYGLLNANATLCQLSRDPTQRLNTLKGLPPLSKEKQMNACRPWQDGLQTSH